MYCVHSSGTHRSVLIREQKAGFTLSHSFCRSTNRLEIPFVRVEGSTGKWKACDPVDLPHLGGFFPLDFGT